MAKKIVKQEKKAPIKSNNSNKKDNKAGEKIVIFKV